VIKHNFNQTPILLENFDQVIRSSEIRSSDPLSLKRRFLKVDIVMDVSLQQPLKITVSK
jgi:hypothetical protein